MQFLLAGNGRDGIGGLFVLNQGLTVGRGLNGLLLLSESGAVAVRYLARALKTGMVLVHLVVGRLRHRMLIPNNRPTMIPQLCDMLRNAQGRLRMIAKSNRLLAGHHVLLALLVARWASLGLAWPLCIRLQLEILIVET